MISDVLKKINPAYFFIILYIITTIPAIMYDTVWDKLYYKYSDILLITEYVLFSLFILFSIFIYKTYTLKKFLIHLLITLVILFVSINAHKHYIFNLWMFILCTSGISFKDIAKIALTITSVCVSTIFLLVVFKQGANLVIPRLEAVYLNRYSFGFVGPNIFAAYLVQICLALTYVRWKKFGILDNIFIFSVFCLVLFCANSRTMSIVLFAALVMINLSKYVLKNYADKFMYYISNSVMFLCPLFSFVTAKLFCNSVPFALMLNDLVSCRIRNICFCMHEFPLTWFGNWIQVRGDLYVLVNIYAVLLLKYGIVLSLMFFIAFFMILKKGRKSIPLLIILTAGFLQGFGETYFLTSYANFGIFALSYLLNNKDLLNDEKSVFT